MNGETISHYRILRHVNDGVGGTVYQAEDLNLRRPVALKFLPRELTGDSEASRRFRREAQATSNIDHPNICNIHEIGETGDGTLFIAMSWYDGPTLKERLAQGRLPTVLALEYARRIADGLARAHESGVVHRDIKPSNIITTAHDELKIIDFGLARLLSLARLTAMGTVMGTAAYMSPEQARGEDAGAASDIWSTGVILYEMLTGELPFRGDNEVAMIYSVLNSDPEPLVLTACPEGCQCRRIIARCLEKDPARRYHSAQELATALNQTLQVARSQERTTDARWRVRETWDRARRLPRSAKVGVVLLVLVASLVLGLGSARKMIPFLGNGPPHGVAVLPFTVSNTDPDDQALANGLSLYLANVIAGVENQTDTFWLVPPGVAQLEALATGVDVQRVIGVGITVSATGHVQGDRITLRLAINDSWQHKQYTHVITDNLANMKTWQQDLPRLVLGDLDRGFKARSHNAGNPDHTNVPGAFRAYLTGLGYAYAVGGDNDYDRARVLFAAAVEQDSSYASGLTGLGYAIWQGGKGSDTPDPDQAEVLLRRATRLAPRDPEPWTYLGRILQAGGRIDEARQAFRQALDLNPSQAAALNGLCQLERAAGNPVAAQAYLVKALAARPDYFDALDELGVFQYYEHNFPAARTAFERLVELAPQRTRGYILLGAVLFEMEDYVQSEIMFENSLAIQPSFTAYANLATLYYYSGRMQDAVEFSRKALAIDDSVYDAWRTMAEAMRWIPGWQDSSRVAFGKCVELVSAELKESAVNGSPGDPLLRSDLATFYVSLEDFEPARALLTDLEQESHLETGVLFNLAAIYEDLHERPQALHWLEQALQAGLSLTQVDQYPGLRNLRTDPRYQVLKQEYGAD